MNVGHGAGMSLTNQSIPSRAQGRVHAARVVRCIHVLARWIDGARGVHVLFNARCIARSNDVHCVASLY